MRKERLLLSYTHLTDYELSTLAGRVLAAMTDNDNFPDPAPSLAELEPLVNTYRTRHEIASRRGSALEISQKNESRQLLLEAFKQLAFYINTVSDGSQPMLVSSGLILASQPREVYVPDIPRLLRLRDGRVSGQMRLDFEPVKDALEYLYTVSDTVDGQGNVVWPDPVLTTRSKRNFIDPVEPGTTYFARVRARNSKGMGDWSETVSLIAR